MFLFSKFVHQTKSLEEGIVFMFMSQLFHRSQLYAGLCVSNIWPWQLLSRETCLPAKYHCVSPHVLLITRAGWVLCRFPRADLVFSMAAHTCLVVHSPIGAHPAPTDPRGCHCSHSRPWAGTAGKSGFAWHFSQWLGFLIFQEIKYLLHCKLTSMEEKLACFMGYKQNIKSTFSTYMYLTEILHSEGKKCL